MGIANECSNSPQHLIAQVRACQRLFSIQQLLWRALEHYSTALVAAFGTPVDDPIGVRDDTVFGSLLRDQDRAPFGGQLGASTPNCLAYEVGVEALPLWEEIWPGPAMKLVVATVNRSVIDRGFLPRWRAHGQKSADRGYLLARGAFGLGFPLTTFLYVSPVQTMLPWDQTGVPGFVAFTHFHSSMISGSAACMISRTFASVLPRQSPSSLIFSSIDAEADSTRTALFMHTSNSRTYLIRRDINCSVDLRSTTAVGDRRYSLAKGSIMVV